MGWGRSCSWDRALICVVPLRGVHVLVFARLSREWCVAGRLRCCNCCCALIITLISSLCLLSADWECAWALASPCARGCGNAAWLNAACLTIPAASTIGARGVVFRVGIACVSFASLLALHGRWSSVAATQAPGTALVRGVLRKLSLRELSSPNPRSHVRASSARNCGARNCGTPASGLGL